MTRSQRRIVARKHRARVEQLPAGDTHRLPTFRMVQPVKVDTAWGRVTVLRKVTERIEIADNPNAGKLGATPTRRRMRLNTALTV